MKPLKILRSELNKLHHLKKIPSKKLILPQIKPHSIPLSAISNNYPRAEKVSQPYLLSKGLKEIQKRRQNKLRKVLFSLQVQDQRLPHLLPKIQNTDESSSILLRSKVIINQNIKSLQLQSRTYKVLILLHCPNRTFTNAKPLWDSSSQNKKKMMSKKVRRKLKSLPCRN